MKKLMKSLMLFAAAAMALTSCENEAMNEGIQENDTYTMTFVAGAPESRTSVSVDGNVAKFAWDAEESFTVVENTTALALAKNVEFNKNGELAEITATFDAVEAEEYNYVAVYPKDAWATSNNDDFNKAKLIFPTKQTMTTNSYDPDADLLVSKVLTTTSQPTEAQMLEFRRLVAIGEMNIKGLQTDGAEKILSVDFAANDAILTGRAYVDLATNTVLEYGYTGQAFKNVNISCAMEVAEANTVYFTCMPATLKSGEAYTITVTTDKAIYTKKGTIGANALEFTEGNVTGFTANMATATREVLESLEGKWVIVTKRSSGNFFYVTPDLGTASTKRFQAVDTNSADIASVDATIEDYHWTIAKYGDNYSIQAPAGTYVSWTSGNSAALADTAKEIVISKVEGKEYYNISLKDEATRVLALNSTSGNNYCAFYTGSGNQEMYLIPAVVDKREKQELSFSYDSITVNMGESITEPNLVGAQTKVTWTSSDNTIASVDGDGFVDLEGGLGTVTITATAEADDYYREGSASYTITVVDPNAVPEAITVAEFLKKDVSNDVWYQLSGTISNITSTYYGNFTLTDGTGSVVVYGLTETKVDKNDHSFESLGLNNGDDVVIIGLRAAYGTTAQVGSSQTAPAYLVDCTKYTQRNLAFSATMVTLNLGDTFEAPTLSGETTGVTYTSSEESVATVNATTGAVEIVGVGTTTITATAPKTDTYAAGSASYTITVNASGSTVVEGGRDDFSTLKANSSYSTHTSTAGWKGTNCAVISGGSSDNNPVFKSLLGTSSSAKAVVINGKTSAKGTITSPTLTTGCGTISLKYGYVFGESNAPKFKVEIKQNGTVINTYTVVGTATTKFKVNEWSQEVNVAGDFQIVITNLSPSNVNSNKDRTAIWDIIWTGYEG